MLILDEPTSHLDIDSREALIHALNNFEGAVLLITHDVYLAEATADQLWLVKDGRVTPYDGDLQDYRSLVLKADRGPQGARPKPGRASKTAAVVAEAKAEKALPAAKVDKAEQRRLASQARKAAAPLKRKADAAEKRRQAAASEIEAIDRQLASPDTSPQQVQALMKTRAGRLEDMEAAEQDWLDAQDAYESSLAQ